MSVLNSCHVAWSFTCYSTSRLEPPMRIPNDPKTWALELDQLKFHADLSSCYFHGKNPIFHQRQLVRADKIGCKNGHEKIRLIAQLLFGLKIKDSSESFGKGVRVAKPCFSTQPWSKRTMIHPPTPKLTRLLSLRRCWELYNERQYCYGQ